MKLDRLDFGGNSVAGGERLDADSGVEPSLSGAFPLSPAQLGIWFAQHMDPQVPISIAQYVDVDGDIDRPVLREASIIASREFGSGFLRIIERDGEPLQYVDYSIPDSDDIGYVDLRAEDDPSAAAAAWMRAEYSRPLYMVNDRLIMSVVLQLADRHWYWYTRVHHIVLDGFGAMTWLKRFAEIYTALLQGADVTPSRATDLHTIYGQEIAYRESSRFVADKEYWVERVAGLEEGTSLARGSAPRAAINGIVSAALSEEQNTLLDAAVARHDSSPAGLLLAGFAAYLAQWNGVEDVILSLPVTARTTAAMRRSGGVSSNIVPLRLHVGHDTTVSGLLKQVQVEVVGALRHQRYRHEDIRRDTAVGAVRTELFGPSVNIMLIHDRLILGQAVGKVRILSTGNVPDLAVNLYQSEGGVRYRIDFETNPNLYTKDEARMQHSRFLKYFKAFLSARADLPIWDLKILSSEESRRVLVDWNDTKHPLPAATLVSLFEAQVARTPDSPAVTFEGTSLSYAE
ncbi:condensation domain-containing protein, partial [Nocardia sp. NPDC051900]|uniref:condensation domain-containing protein n=1 Tax=Nocardia sp. NPDC051900 TaxID=3364326 RepID=UPI00378F68A3